MPAGAEGSRIDTERRRGRWRRRARFWLLVTSLGALANLLSTGLPGAVPLLVGNIAPLALVAHLRWPWVLASAVLVAAAAGSTAWWGFSLLHVAVAVALLRHAGSRRRLLYLQLGLLSPVAFWLTLPADDGGTVAWLAGGLVLLVGVTIAQVGAWQLVHLNRNPALLARRSMGSQLSSTLIVATLPSLGLLFLLLAQFAWQVELLRRGSSLGVRAQYLQSVVHDYIQQHRRTVEMTALTASPTSLPQIEPAAATHPGFLTMLVSDAEGEIVDFHAPMQPEFVGSVADREYFQHPRRHGGSFVSPVFQGRGFGQDILVAISAAWTDAEGRFAGVVQGALALASLQQRIADTARLQGVEFVVLDTRAQVVVATLPGMQALDGGPVPALTLGPQRSGTTLNLPQSHMLSIRALPELGWQVAVLEPLAPLAAMQTQTALLIGLLCLLALGALGRRVQRLALSFTEPLQQLVARVREVDLTRSETLRPLRVRAANAEFAELRDDFDAMLQRIRELTDELRQALHAQEVLNVELEERVEQRTAELRAATAEAQHLANAKSVLLSNMSHELRTPLTAILGHAEEALRSDRPSRDWEATLRIVLRNGRHLLEIVNDILDAGRIDAGQMRVQPEAVELLPLLDDVVAMFADRATQKGLQFGMRLEFPLPLHVHADPLRLRQVLINLLGNAIKFTETGEVRLHAACASGCLRLAVVDSGIGMDDEQRSRLFRPFEQADMSTTRRFGGSGLGLYISARLAEAMGGEITVDSSPGAGSRFTVALPLAPESPMLHEPPTRGFEPVPEPVLPKLRGRVLVVDDVEDLRMLTASIVGATGAETDLAADGAEAVALAGSLDYDLVLMDMHMPVLDGRAATRRLRDTGYTRPIVALSADVLSEDVQRFRAAGCDDVLAKPIDRAALHGVLQRFLPAAGDRANAAPSEHAAETLPAGLGAALDGIRRRFFARLPEEADALRRALQREDRQALQERLHRLKGSCGTFGLDDLSELAARAEDALRPDGDWHEACDRLLRSIESTARA